MAPSSRIPGPLLPPPFRFSYLLPLVWSRVMRHGNGRGHPGVMGAVTARPEADGIDV